MSFLSKIQQTQLVADIKNNHGFDFITENGLIIDFTAEIWDIDNMPSKDMRYSTLRGYIRKHMIDNDDDDIDYLFSELVPLYGDEGHYKTFLETIVKHKYQDSVNLVNTLVLTINEYLLPHGLCLYNVGEDEDRFPKYSLQVYQPEIDNSGIPQNAIPFFVVKDPSEITNLNFSRKSPEESLPAFVLVSNSWDDFSVKSQFDLYYYSNPEVPSLRLYIGSFKILNINQNKAKRQTYKVINYLPSDFENLSEDFCSLGQSQQYYDRIKKTFGNNYQSILWALKDCSIFSSIADKFEKHPFFHLSLIRDDNAERILRLEKHIMEERPITSCQKFSYSFRPKYAKDPIFIKLSFDTQKKFPQRVFAIIGQNGTGKTQFITKLPIDIAEKKEDVFAPTVPLYSKVIAVSNSFYDNFEVPHSTPGFNYVYCGLSKKENGRRTIISQEELKKRLVQSAEDINGKRRGKSLKKILSRVLPSNIINELFDSDENDPKININGIIDIPEAISSGESTLLYLFCNIISNIRFDSLLLFDEPETHMHPNAITELMSAIYDLLDEYDSYAIITTHSPLIIREMKSDGVRVMDRIEDVPTIRKISMESLGASISALIDEIFDNKDIPKYYRDKIYELVKSGISEEDLKRSIKSDDMPLGIALQLYINQLYMIKNEKD